MDTNLFNNNFKTINLGSCIPYAVYNSFDIDKTFWYIANKEKLNFDINSIVRLLVCDSYLHPGNYNGILDRKKSYYFNNQFGEKELIKTLSILSKYKTTILGSAQKSMLKLLNREKSGIGLIFLLNNGRILQQESLFNATALNVEINPKFRDTILVSDILSNIENFEFCDNLGGTKKDLRHIKTLASKHEKKHLCLIGRYNDIDNRAIAQLIKLKQTFCLSTTIDNSVFSKKAHDEIVKSPRKGIKLFDGYIKEKTVTCSVPIFNYKKKREKHKIRLVCFYSDYIKQLHQSTTNFAEQDKGWICFLTNEPVLNKKRIMRIWYVNNTSTNKHSLTSRDYNGTLLINTTQENIDSYFVLYSISHAIRNLILLMLNPQNKLSKVENALKDCNLYYLDEDQWLLNNLDEVSKELFSMLDLPAKKFMNDKEILQFFKQGQNAKKIREIYKDIQNAL